MELIEIGKRAKAVNTYRYHGKEAKKASEDTRYSTGKKARL